MPLINCKVELSLNWIDNCILSSARLAATFTITVTKRDVPIVTLKIEDNTKLSKLLSEGFKRSIYWNKYKYKVIHNILVEIVNDSDEKYIRELFDSSWQGVKRLFALAYNNKEGNRKVSVDFFKKICSPKN